MHSITRSTPAWTRALAIAALASGLGFSQLTDFGYGRMTMNGVPAQGGRPLVVVLVNYVGYPELAHGADYFDRLVFDYTSKSANGFFIENSHGRFYWQRGGKGVYGPFYYPYQLYKGDSNPGVRAAAALQTLSTQLDFSQFDANGDGVVTQDELAVLMVENASVDSGGNRTPVPACFTPTNSPVQVCFGNEDAKPRGAVAMVGHLASFSTICHELMHRLGAIEMYGLGKNENFLYTLMGSTIIGYDDPRTFHLDPWHKMMLGWTEPRIYSMDSPGSATIAAPQSVNGSEPVILYSSAHGTLEFYLLEFRSNTYPDGPSYDASVPGTGLVVWHIQTLGKGGPDVNSDVGIIDSSQSPGQGMITAFMNGAPNFSRGSGKVWPPSTTIPYSLRWINALDSGVQLKVGALENGGRALDVSWGPYQATAPNYPRKLLFYSRTAGSAAIAGIGPDTTLNTLTTYPSGTFGAWTQVAGDAVELVFYDSGNGSVATGEVDANGNFTTTRYLPPGRLSTGWTHVVRHNGFLLFYNANSGHAAVGQFEGQGFHQYGAFPNFSVGWTSIVSTPAGLLFYNAKIGSAAIADWTYTKSGGGFSQITAVGIQISSLYGPGTLSTDWTHIVPTPNGVLFYAASNGAAVIADVTADHHIVTRPGSAQYLRTGWTHIAGDSGDLLFYDTTSGDGAVASLVGTDVQTRQDLSGALSKGWTNITTSIDR